MREIKFRGKRLDNGEWVYGWYSCVTKDGWLNPIQNGNYITTSKELKNGEIILTGMCEVILETVGQYTGLKDKDGVMIFDGDILSCGDGLVPTEIKWNDESHAYYAFNLKRKEYHRLDKYFNKFIRKVIGNRWDNPELVEVRSETL